MPLLPSTSLPALAVGLMSGTSADGIDAALVRLQEDDGRLRPMLLAFRCFPYPPEVRERLLRCFAGKATPAELCALNARIGDLLADAAEAVAGEAGEPVRFVASHGQTVWHEPAGPERGTLQLGEAARIAVRLGVPVVCDFRQQDLAVGGQGAPLVPLADWLLFAHATESRAVQNLGGIGNVTYLPAGGSEDSVTAFDTGPGNCLIDLAAAMVTAGREQYDRDGRLAASAGPDRDQVERLLALPYFAQPPPKSTGRELFGEALVQELRRRGLEGAPLVSTLTELTARSIAHAYRAWLGPVDRVILAGGGARNPELVRRITRALAPVPVELSDAHGVDPDAREAMSFAVLGYRTLCGLPGNLPSATGAPRSVPLGKICLPPA